MPAFFISYLGGIITNKKKARSVASGPEIISWKKCYFTVSVAVAGLVPFIFTVTVTVPALMPVASPFFLGGLFMMVATDVFEEYQFRLGVFVMSWLDPSE